MPTKRQQQQIEQRRELRNDGYDLHDDIGIRPNSGSESLRHLVTKTVAAKVLIDTGYRIDSEVAKVKNHESIGEVDLLAFGMGDRRPIVVEAERDVDRDVVLDKLDRYNAPSIREVYVLDVDDLPTDPDEMYDDIRTELGL